MNFVNPSPFTTRPEIDGTFGVVTSTHWLATAVGMGILERGGNAFDAACATAFTLQVVEPHLNGPGGDVPVILYDVRRGKPEVICGQGSVPAGATIAHYRDKLGLDLVPGTGLLAACIPGTFDTWMTLLRDYGTMRISDVLSPAISYARQGYPVVERISATIDTVKELFQNHWPTSAAVYLPGGKVPRPGTLFTNPKLAETYERILKEAQNGGDREAEIERARKTWREGFVAEAIDKFCRTQDVMDTSGRPHRGVLTGDDMAKWQATVEAPIAYDYGRYTVLKAGPWTQGLVTLQQLALVKGFGFDGLDPRGPDFIHWQVECAKLAFADRDTFYGDPKFVDVPIETLLVRRLQRRAPQAGHRRGVARDPSRHDRRLRQDHGACASPRARAPRSARPGQGSRRSARSRGRTTRTTCRMSSPCRRRSARRWARCRATRCISTSSTATATWCRRRRPAAGCIPRR